MKDCKTAQDMEDTRKRFDRVRDETEQVNSIKNYLDELTRDRKLPQ